MKGYPDYINVDRSFSQTCFARLSSLTLIYLCAPPLLIAAVNYEKKLLYLCISTLLMFVCFPGVTTHRGCIFHSPVAGFSLLVFEVS